MTQTSSSSSHLAEVPLPQFDQDHTQTVRVDDRVAYRWLLAFAFVVYFPTLWFGFLNWDDVEYFTNNRFVKQGFCIESWNWCWTTFYAANYHPATWLSLMLDAQIWGTRAFGFHLTNVVLHALNGCLVYFILSEATGRRGPSWWAAVLFVIHPFHVESVAWVSERKDVLSVFFGLGSITAYLAYARQPHWKPYVMSVGLFLVSLLSKQTLVTLPCVLLLLDWWPLLRVKRFSPVDSSLSTRFSSSSLRNVLLEKVPFFVLAGVFSVIVVAAQRQGGAYQTIDQLALSDRLANSVVSYGRYLGKTFFPIGFSPFYVYSAQTPMISLAISSVVLLTVSAVSMVWVLTRPFLFVGWFWFLGTFVPMIGVVQVGSQAMADRYTYFPHIGLFLAVTFGVADLLQWWRSLAGVIENGSTKWTPRHKTTLRVLAISTLVVVTLLTFRQVLFWRSDDTLWAHALSLNDNNPMAHVELAHHYYEVKNFDLARAHLTEAIRLSPNLYSPLFRLGMIEKNEKKYDRAIELMAKAISIEPTIPGMRIHLGICFAQRNRLQNAIDMYNKELELDPRSVEATYNRAVAWDRLGLLDQALEGYRDTLKLDPKHRNATFNFQNLSKTLKRR